ncbi:Amino-acid permease BAT1 homolog [Coccomyxa sp. Obi]|nr:Amino-acid permease BAT1 homolog [Coccomyxa sp. Obi]
MKYLSSNNLAHGKLGGHDQHFNMVLSARGNAGDQENGHKKADLDSGEARLQALGYKQELRREFGLLSSTCSSLAFMAFSSGITCLFGVAYSNGGPFSALWGWVIVAIMNIFVALSMAEVVSAFPVAGGPYFWCLELLRNEPRYIVIGWCTGWLNVVGQFAATAANALLLSNHLATMWILGNGHAFTAVETLLVYAIVLVLVACVATFSTRGMQCFALAAGWFLVSSGVLIAVMLPIVAPTHRSASFVFATFETEDVGRAGVPNAAYLFLLGLLMAQGTFIGFETPAQFAEETKRADATVPRAIVISVVVNAFIGFAYLLAILFCIQRDDDLVDGEAQGYIVAQVFYDCFQARFGSGAGALVLMGIPMITTFNSTVLSLATNARMLWSFARDGGVPLHRVWCRLSACTGTPVNAVWAMAALAFLLGLPMLYSLTIFQAVASISSVGLYTSYAVPIILRMLRGRDFEVGPFRLGAWQLPVNLAAVTWVAISTVSFIMPTSYPVALESFNWTPVTLGAALLAVLVGWFMPRYGAAVWYHGKTHTLIDDTARGAGPNGGGPKQQGVHTGAHTRARLTLYDLLEDTLAKEATLMTGVARTRLPVVTCPPAAKLPLASYGTAPTHWAAKCGTGSWYCKN